MIFMNANEPKINWHQDFLYPSHKKDCKCGSPDQIKDFLDDLITQTRTD